MSAGGNKTKRPGHRWTLYYEKKPPSAVSLRTADFLQGNTPLGSYDLQVRRDATCNQQ